MSLINVLSRTFGFGTKFVIILSMSFCFLDLSEKYHFYIKGRNNTKIYI